MLSLTKVVHGVGAVVLSLVVAVTGITGAAAADAGSHVGEGQILAGPGDFGFACHRIPALTQAPNGDLLAAWDGRPGSCRDAPQANSIVQSVSSDGGKTWSDPEVIAAGHPRDPIHGYSDPSYVVDHETGTVFMFFVKSFDQGFRGSQPGTDPADRNVLHAAVIESHDNGHTWSAPRVITDQITTKDSWRSRFAASGRGIQLRYSPYAGRLLQQYTIATTDGQMRAVSVYSDDHGKTWHAGEAVGTGMDENKVVELSNGNVMLNSRSSQGAGYRLIAISKDGGETYGEVHRDETLVDPRNNASIICAYPKAPKGSERAKVLLFSNAASATSRVNGTIRVSYDNGKTWPVSKVFEPGDMAYSTLTPLDTPGKYGLLYEGKGPTINYMSITLDWLGARSVPKATPMSPSPSVSMGSTADSTPMVPPSVTTSPISTASSNGSSTTKPTATSVASSTPVAGAGDEPRVSGGDTHADDKPGTLPNTGSAGILAMLALAVALIAAGSTVFLRRRKH